MKNYILTFPNQFKKGIEAVKDIKIREKFDNVIICGMGGSAWPAELLIDLINFNPSDWRVQNCNILVNKNYNLPYLSGNRNLVIAISYSGNTQETVSCFNKALEIGAYLIVITTDGKLEKLAKEKKIPAIILPVEVSVPRLGCGYTFSSLYKLLANLGIIKQKDEEILKMARSLEPLELESKGRKLAEKMEGKIPVIYSSFELKTLSYIWKIKLNESSKIPAFCNWFPELNHNELSSYEVVNKIQQTLGNFFVIILCDQEDNLKIKKRIELTSEIVKQKGYDVEVIKLSGKNVLERSFKSIILADWTSYYLAMRYKVDPLSTLLQEKFKRKMENLQ